ncbi:MAG: hypothetical protein ACJ72Z_03180 [Pyrinomonadaceae bacterium]
MSKMGTQALLPKKRSVRRPFWLPASSFYFLIAAIAVASFFLVVGIFSNGDREPELVAAGLTASGILIAGVFVREVVLRHARERYIIERNRLDANLRNPVPVSNDQRSSKFTLEMNSTALDHIRKKSEAAKVFSRLSAAHKEVFELCEEYRSIISAEIPNIHPDSPRLKALIRGNGEALKLHKWHVLKWAEIESRSLASEARDAENAEKRAEFARKAKRAIEFALERYPEEKELSSSAILLDEVLCSIRVSGMISDAEHLALAGLHNAAIEKYKDALFFIEHETEIGSFFDIKVQIEAAIADLEPER